MEEYQDKETEVGIQRSNCLQKFLNKSCVGKLKEGHKRCREYKRMEDYQDNQDNKP